MLLLLVSFPTVSGSEVFLSSFFLPSFFSSSFFLCLFFCFLSVLLVLVGFESISQELKEELDMEDVSLLLEGEVFYLLSVIVESSLHHLIIILYISCIYLLDFSFDDSNSDSLISAKSSGSIL